MFVVRLTCWHVVFFPKRNAFFLFKHPFVRGLLGAALHFFPVLRPTNRENSLVTPLLRFPNHFSLPLFGAPTITRVCRFAGGRIPKYQICSFLRWASLSNNERTSSTMVCVWWGAPQPSLFGSHNPGRLFNTSSLVCSTAAGSMRKRYHIPSGR